MPLLPAFVRDCRTATRLIERRAATALAPAERLRLWAHLRLCVYCRRYEAQSALLARLAPRLARPTAAPTEAQQAQWRAQIADALRQP
jgi:predicted anti-sigma-YlaC factor YlaD